MTEITLQGHFEARDQASDEFPLLPFEVPPGIARMHVRYQVSHALSADKVGWQEGNVVDLGIFDPRGAQFLAGRGFRGWSGTTCRQFTLSKGEATPGYLPGPILPGTWHIQLGLYQLAPEGCDYEITITLEPGATEAVEERTAPVLPDAPMSGPRWYRGDLHTHTWHSDGSAPLADLVAAAQAQGLDFVAVTEHNTISHLPLLRRQVPTDLLLIPGVEISTYHGHANVWPVDSFVEFRCQTRKQMAQMRDDVRARGALFSVNHPKDGGPPWEFGDLLSPDCIEVWGAPWITSNYQALALWDAQLRQGRRITAVGGSDKHQGPFSGELGWYEVGTPCTWVFAEELSVAGILAGIQAGHVFISEAPAGPVTELTAEAEGRRAMMGDQLRVSCGARLSLRCQVRGGAGALLRLVSPGETRQVSVVGDDFAHEVQVLATGDGFWRAEVIEPPEVPLNEEPAALMARALSNPIYLKIT